MDKTQQPPAKGHRVFLQRFRWLWWTLGIMAASFIIVGLLNTFVFTEVKNPRLGVTFTKERADEFGMDWQANYTALLDDMQLKHFRLTSYWSSHEVARGQFNFDDLDWLIDQAARRKVKVSLALGLRQPRWPECHQPAWATELSGHAWKQALYAYIEVVVNRYKNNPTVESWQLENEAVNNWFGHCTLPDRQRLQEEFDLVKKLDSSRPLVMSLSDQHGLPLRGPVPEKYGFSVYRIVYNTFGPWHFYTYYPTPIWYHRARAVLIDWIQHKPIIVHELQMEPWGPKDTKELSTSEQDRSMSPSQIHKNMKFARQIGAKDIDMWGGEWWYWRKVQHNDNTIWNAVRQEVVRARSGQ